MTRGSEATKQYVFCGRLLPSPGYADGQEQTSSSPPKFAGASLSKRSRSPAENSSGRLTGSSLGPDDWRGYVFATSKSTCFGLFLYIVFIFIFLMCKVWTMQRRQNIQLFLWKIDFLHNFLARALEDLRGEFD